MTVTTNNDNTILTFKSIFGLILFFAIHASNAQLPTLLTHLLVCTLVYFHLMSKVLNFVEICVALLARNY